MKKIIIETKGGEITLDVKPLDNVTREKITQSLPIVSKAKMWGDEIYFDIGITAPTDNSTLDVDVGDIAYWPDGKCLCIFFGKTPASSSDKPVPASEVVIVGKAGVDPCVLREVKPGAKIKVT